MRTYYVPVTENGQAGRKGHFPRGDPPQNAEMGSGPARTEAPDTLMTNSTEVWVVLSPLDTSSTSYPKTGLQIDVIDTTQTSDGLLSWEVRDLSLCGHDLSLRHRCGSVGRALRALRDLSIPPIRICHFLLTPLWGVPAPLSATPLSH